MSLVGNSGHGSRKSSATHSYQCVQYVCVSKQCYGCQCLGFLMCSQMLMHAIAHGGCTDTVRVFTGSWRWEKKIPCRTRDWKLRQYCAWLFSRMLYQLSYPHLIVLWCIIMRQSVMQKDWFAVLKVVTVRAHMIKIRCFCYIF